MFTDDFDKPIRIFIVFSYIVITVLLISLIITVYNDVKLNGSPFIPMMDALKFYCNGHLEYFDNRKAMGMLQFFKGREKWETDTSDI